MWMKLKNFFLDYINWCYPVFSTGKPKELTLFYKVFCYIFWPIPWQDEPCWCCAGTRGLMTGFIIGAGVVWAWFKFWGC